MVIVGVEKEVLDSPSLSLQSLGTFLEGMIYPGKEGGRLSSAGRWWAAASVCAMKDAVNIPSALCESIWIERTSDPP